MKTLKKNVPFLKHDVNCHHAYELIKSGKNVLNLNKETIYNQHHSTIHDYSLIPSNTFAEYPFSGSSWYTDFNLPKIPLCYNSFVLRFKLSSNNPNDTFYYLPIPMLLERVVLLKNSTVLSETNSEDILLYNLHKISNKYNTSYTDIDYKVQLGFENDDKNQKLFIAPYFFVN